MAYLALLTAVIVGFVTWLYWMLLPRVYPEVPYRKASAKRLLGDLPVLAAYSQRTRQYSRALAAIPQELGVPFAQFLTTKFDAPTFVVNDPREVEDILLRRNREFDRADVTIAMFKSLLPECTIAQHTTPKLRAQKRQWADVMNTDFLRRVVAPQIREAGVDLIKLWRLKAAKMDGQPFKAHKDLSNAALDAIWASILGNKLGIMEAGIADFASTSVEGKRNNKAFLSAITVSEAVEYANHVIGGGVTSIWPSFYYWRKRQSPTFRRHMAASDAEINRIMLAACERFSTVMDGGDGDKYDTCAMDLVLRREIVRAKKAGEPPVDPTKDPAMKQELFLMLAAGHDSTANTMAWFVKFMALFPLVQTELRNRVQSIFQNNPTPLASDILEANIPYLEGVIEETLRLGAPSATTSRDVMVNTKVLGYDIPAGSALILDLAMWAPPLPVPEERRSATSQTAGERHTRTGLIEQTAEDLSRFEPLRWVSTDEKGEEVFDALSLPTLTFGGGLRGCFGKKLAIQELRILIVLLVLNFEFLPPPSDLTGMDAEESIFRKPQQCFVKVREL